MVKLFTKVKLTSLQNPDMPTHSIWSKQKAQSTQKKIGYNLQKLFHFQNFFQLKNKDVQ